MNTTLTLTFGDICENHVGNQQIGKDADEGLNYEDITNIKEYYDSLGCECILYDLKDLLENKMESESAYFLVIKNGINNSTKYNKEELIEEHLNLEWDKKCLMYKKVVNKHARHNLCYGDFSQEPEYENGKGRVYNFNDLKVLNDIRINLGTINEKLKNLMCEGNLYYNTDKCYIGFHGDTERKIVVGCRLGNNFPLYYQWYLKFKPVGNLFTIDLEDGDMYFMSSKAVGTDWKKSSKLTLRHAAGSKKSVKL